MDLFFPKNENEKNEKQNPFHNLSQDKDTYPRPKLSSQTEIFAKFNGRKKLIEKFLPYNWLENLEQTTRGVKKLGQYPPPPPKRRKNVWKMSIEAIKLIKNSNCIAKEGCPLEQQ